MDAIIIGSDNKVEWSGMIDEDSGEFVNDATVTYTLKDAAGNVVEDAEDIAMSYVAASDGDYLGVIDSSVTTTLTEGDIYYIELTAVAGSLNGFKRLPRVAAFDEE